MSFKNPELLFALILLVIPILIHLFQLRKFQKTAFTNLKYLKNLQLQTRKSALLKKWLVLFTRILALTCLIIAFAQPFLKQKNANFALSETVIYIDNSLSLQAKGAQGEILKSTLQELYKNANLPQELRWFSNDKISQKGNTQDFKNALLELSYSSKNLTMGDALLKAQDLFTKDSATTKNLIWISDFQGQEPFPSLADSDLLVSTLQLKPSKTNNIAIDSIFVSSITGSKVELSVMLTNFGEPVENVPISLFNNNELIAKTATSFDKQETTTIFFEIDDRSFDGRVSIMDQSLPFDNQLFFNLNPQEKINVLVIDQGNASFLKKIYTSNEFNFVSQPLNTLDFNLIQKQNLIILNQLNSLDIALQNTLQTFVDKGGTLLLIPALEINVDSYNNFLERLQLGSFKENNALEQPITTIHFSNPLFENVFENQVSNFQYPTVKNHYRFNDLMGGKNGLAALSFEDKSPFLVQKQQVFIFTGAIALENSNFINSPLVVPTLYRIAKQSLTLPKLFYTIGEFNHYDIQAQLPQGHIVRLKNETVDFIPLQQNNENSVRITTIDQPDTPGIYGVFDKETRLQHVSYNFSRTQSNLQYKDASTWKGSKNYQNPSALFEKLSQKSQEKNLWKWFLIFAIIFLAIEILLLKLLK